MNTTTYAQCKQLAKKECDFVINFVESILNETCELLGKYKVMHVSNVRASEYTERVILVDQCAIGSGDKQCVRISVRVQKDGKPHSTKGYPSTCVITTAGQVFEVVYTRYRRPLKRDGPNYIEFSNMNGILYMECQDKRGRPHNKNGPATINICKNLACLSFFEDGKPTYSRQFAAVVDTIKAILPQPIWEEMETELPYKDAQWFLQNPAYVGAL